MELPKKIVKSFQNLGTLNNIYTRRTSEDVLGFLNKYVYGKRIISPAIDQISDGGLINIGWFAGPTLFVRINSVRVFVGNVPADINDYSHLIIGDRLSQEQLQDIAAIIYKAHPEIWVSEYPDSEPDEESDTETE